MSGMFRGEISTKITELTIKTIGRTLNLCSICALLFAVFSGLMRSENKNHLNGMVPAIVGEDQMCRVEIYCEPDTVEKAGFYNLENIVK